MTDSETLDHLIALWTSPTTGLGQIADILDDLAARRGTRQAGVPDRHRIHPFSERPDLARLLPRTPGALARMLEEKDIDTLDALEAAPAATDSPAMRDAERERRRRERLELLADIPPEEDGGQTKAARTVYREWGMTPKKDSQGGTI